MPVAVVALAAGSFAAGVTAFAAATTLAATVAAGATIVGSALTIAGTVTGNTKLAKIGGILSIAGGIGTALTSTATAGAEAAASAASDTAGSAAADAGASAAADAASSAVQTMPVAPPGGIETMGLDAATNAAPAGGMLDQVAAAAPAAPIAPPAPPAAAAASMGADTAATAAAAAPAADVAGATAASTAASAAPTPGMLDSVMAPTAGGPSATAFNTANTAAGQAGASNVFNANATAVGQANNINAFSTGTGGMLDSIEAFPGAIDAANVASGVSDPSMLSSLQAWAKTNPELAKMALSGIGAAAGQLVPSAKDKAMMQAYAAQAAASQAQTEAQKRRALWGSGRTE